MATNIGTKMATQIAGLMPELFDSGSSIVANCMTKGINMTVSNVKEGTAESSRHWD